MNLKIDFLSPFSKQNSILLYFRESILDAFSGLAFEFLDLVHYLRNELTQINLLVIYGFVVDSNEVDRSRGDILDDTFIIANQESLVLD